MADRQVLELKRGDTRPQFRGRCEDRADISSPLLPVSLATAASAKFLMRSDDGTTIVAAPVVIEDQTANTGWVHRAWAMGDTDTAGIFPAEVEVTWSDGTVQTFPPQGGTIFVIITGDLG